MTILAMITITLTTIITTSPKYEIGVTAVLLNLRARQFFNFVLYRVQEMQA